MLETKVLKNYTLSDRDLVFNHLEKQYVFRVRDLPLGEKPREKLIERGPESLSVNELLAIILGVGTKKEEVLAMSSRIIKEYGEKSIAYQTNAKKISEDLGIPLTKACQIVAAFELGRKFFQKNTSGAVTIRTPRQAYEYLKDMRDLPKENLRGLYLNSRYRLVHDEVISIGSLTANVVHPREVFKPAFEYGAVAVVLAHNHPSGSTQPSPADIEITRRLIKAGRVLGIDLLDHIIIAKNRYVSIEAEYDY